MATKTPTVPSWFLLAAVVLAAISGIVIGATSVGIANGSEHVTPKATAEAAETFAPAPYNTGSRWPDDIQLLCIEDHTNGFPVREAAAEFDGLVDMFVTKDCGATGYVIEVVTINDPDMNYTGWWSAEQNELGRNERGLIEINVAQAYRMDPRNWRLTLVHELGHAVGLEHTYEEFSVMRPDGKDIEVDGLTKTDRQMIRSIWGAR